jgi:hypothetical protein
LLSAALCCACLLPLAQTASAAPPVSGAAPSQASALEVLHAQAVQSFKSARYPEAFGRFVALADAGHAPSAQLALFMYQHGPDLFGRDWDTTQDQLTAWAQLNGQPAPVQTAREYSKPAKAAAVLAHR